MDNQVMNAKDAVVAKYAEVFATVEGKPTDCRLRLRKRRELRGP